MLRLGRIWRSLLGGDLLEIGVYDEGGIGKWSLGFNEYWFKMHSVDRSMGYHLMPGFANLIMMSVM